MNCVFICVFHQEKYLEMLFLLLESIFIYGNLNAEILIYTTTDFMNKIKQTHFFYEKIVFALNEYNSISDACIARLDLFNLPISKYNKILYLDTDIIIKDNLNKVFDICTEDILYVLEEGHIQCDTDWWGKSLFGDESYQYRDKSAFSSGIMLFKNCMKIKELFRKIKEDICVRRHRYHDQPHIVYYAFKYNLYNNKLMKLFAVNNNINIQGKVIHHFPGGPGIYKHKIIAMKQFLNCIKNKTIINNIKKTKLYINTFLIPIIKKSGELLEGNIFMFHHTINYTPLFLNKIKNITSVVLNKNIKNVMEVGFNAGFSALLMLISNPEIHITCYDNGEHSYMLPCYEKIKETFGDRINLVLGDSRQTLPAVLENYDLIHIDGGYETDVAENNIVNSYRLSKQGTIMIMNDYDSHLRELWDKYIAIYNLKPLKIDLYKTSQHIIRLMSGMTKS